MVLMGRRDTKEAERFVLLLIIGLWSISIVSAAIPTLPPIPAPPGEEYTLDTWASPTSAEVGSIVNIYASYTNDAGEPVSSECSLEIIGETIPMGYDESSELYHYETSNLPLGTHQFTVTCSIDSASNEVNIIPSDENIPPSISNTGPFEIVEGDLLTFTVEATDPDGPDLMLSHDSVPEGMVQTDQSSSGEGDGFHSNSMSFSWTPGYEQSGEYVINFVATDTIQTADHDVVITVSDANSTSIPPLPDTPTLPSNLNDDDSDNQGSSSSGGSGSGSTSSSSSSGGSSYNFNPQSSDSGCVEDWTCTTWSACSSGFKRRSCYDINNCETDNGRPVLVDKCEESCTNNVQDNNEEGIDCGGECPACAPKIERPPLSVFGTSLIKAIPGKPIVVPITNNGNKAWSNVILDVENKQVSIDEILPGQTIDVKVPVPLARLLAFDELKATLYEQGGSVIDSTRLAVEVEFPDKYSVVVDGNSEPLKMYVLFNNRDGDKKLTGVEADVLLLKDDVPVYQDRLGPFKIDKGEVFVRSSIIPTGYVSKGDYKVQSNFFEKGKNLGMITTSFSTNIKGGFAWTAIWVIIFSALFVFILYEAIDMIYNKKTFSEMVEKFIKRR